MQSAWPRAKPARRSQSCSGAFASLPRVVCACDVGVDRVAAASSALSHVSAGSVSLTAALCVLLPQPASEHGDAARARRATGRARGARSRSGAAAGSFLFSAPDSPCVGVRSRCLRLLPNSLLSIRDSADACVQSCACMIPIFVPALPVVGTDAHSCVPFVVCCVPRVVRTRAARRPGESDPRQQDPRGRHRRFRPGSLLFRGPVLSSLGLLADWNGLLVPLAGHVLLVLLRLLRIVMCCAHPLRLSRCLIALFSLLELHRAL